MGPRFNVPIKKIENKVKFNENVMYEHGISYLIVFCVPNILLFHEKRMCGRLVRYLSNMGMINLRVSSSLFWVCFRTARQCFCLGLDYTKE